VMVADPSGGHVEGNQDVVAVLQPHTGKVLWTKEKGFQHSGFRRAITGVENAFCPTGEGGGQDNSCSRSGVLLKGGKPVVLYHGGSVRKDGPVFLSSDKTDAEEYGKASSYHVILKNPLEMENSGTSPELIAMAEKAGITDWEKFPEGDVYSKTLEELSPSEQGNHLPDLLYHPGVRDELRKAGYDGLHLQDELFGGTTDAYVVLGKEQVVKPIKQARTPKRS
jgi:hypothetical protein